MIPQIIPHRRLQPAETKIIIRIMNHRPRKFMRRRIPTLRQPIHRRPARITQAQQLRRLIKALSRRIIDGRSQHTMPPLFRHMHKQRVPTAHNQRNIRLKLLELRSRRLSADPRRIQMRLVMMHAHKRLPHRKRKRLPSVKSDQERCRQTRPLRRRHGINFLRPQSSLRQRPARDRQQIPQMLPRRQLRHHPAIFRMQLHL
jgi:hypothetical protein